MTSKLAVAGGVVVRVGVDSRMEPREYASELLLGVVGVVAAEVAVAVAVAVASVASRSFVRESWWPSVRAGDVPDDGSVCEASSDEVVVVVCASDSKSSSSSSESLAPPPAAVASLRSSSHVARSKSGLPSDESAELTATICLWLSFSQRHQISSSTAASAARDGSLFLKRKTQRSENSCVAYAAKSILSVPSVEVLAYAHEHDLRRSLSERGCTVFVA